MQGIFFSGAVVGELELGVVHEALDELDADGVDCDGTGEEAEGAIGERLALQVHGEVGVHR